MNKTVNNMCKAQLLGFDHIQLEDGGASCQQETVSDLGRVNNKISEPVVNDLGRVLNKVGEPAVNDQGRVLNKVSEPTVNDLSRVLNKVGESPD